MKRNFILAILLVTITVIVVIALFSLGITKDNLPAFSANDQNRTVSNGNRSNVSPLYQTNPTMIYNLSQESSPPPNEQNLSGEALRERLNNTNVLLSAPIGGFDQGLIVVASIDTKGEANYLFHTRDHGPAMVHYRVSSVERPWNTTPLANPDDLEVTLEPSQFYAYPNTSYTSTFRVNLTSPQGYENELKVFTFFVQAYFEGENETLGDDWIRVFVGDKTVPGISGFYQGHAQLPDDQHVLTLHPGESGTVTYILQAGIGETGPVTYNLSLISGKLNMVPMPEEEKSPFLPGLHVTIEPNNFISRSFGYYPSVVTVKIDADLPPWNYTVLIDTRTSSSLTNDQLVVQVVS